MGSLLMNDGEKRMGLGLENGLERGFFGFGGIRWSFLGEGGRGLRENAFVYEGSKTCIII